MTFKFVLAIVSKICYILSSYIRSVRIYIDSMKFWILLKNMDMEVFVA